MHPRAGLAVPDFRSGSVLQLTGRARISAVPGAERLIELLVDEVVEIAGVLRPTESVDYSPFNPPVEWPDRPPAVPGPG